MKIGAECNKKWICWGYVFFGFLLTSCGGWLSLSPIQTPIDPLPYILVTNAPYATPSPTPLKPAPVTPTPVPPILPTYTATITPTATLTPIPSSTVIIDFSALIPKPGPLPEFRIPSFAPPPSPVLGDYETVNFLLIGSDERFGSSFRTDTLVIVVLRPKDQQVTLISIPRDLWVYIPDWDMQRINTAYQHGELTNYPSGGPGLLKHTILYNLGIRIDHTAMVDFNGFRLIVDTLEGVNVPIACPYTDWHLIDPSLDPNDEGNWELYTVNPGVVHMDGDLALWYARSRKRSSDFDRGRRQQEVLRALHASALHTDALEKLPQLYQDLNNTVTTDLNLTDLLQLAIFAPRMTNADIRSYYIRPPLVTSWITPLGAYVLLPERLALQTMIQEALMVSDQVIERKKIIVEIQNGTINDGWDAAAASRLNYAGYETRIMSEVKKDYVQSLLIDMTREQRPDQADSLLTFLGLPHDSLVSMADPDSSVDYRLILGIDYQPCFDPTIYVP